MRRAQFDLNSQAIRNLVYNPSFEAAGASAILRTNLVENPSLETAGAAIVARTNILTNPSAETASGTINTRANLALNPSFEATIGTYDVRTNLAVNPSFETANGSVNVRTNLFNGSTMLLGAGATQVTGVSYGGSSWTRLSTTTAGHGLRAYVNLADLVNGATYAAEWEVANDGASSVGISLDWCDTSTSGGFHTIAAGERKRIKVIGTKATYDATYRFADIGLSTENTNILFREILIEKDDISGPYFDGATAASGDFTYAWTGTANASASNQVGTGLTGVGPANQAAVYRTGSTGARAAKILFKGTTIADSGLSFAGMLTVAASKTYTVSVDLTSDINRLVKFSAQGTGTVNQNSANISLTAGVTSRQSWTFTTTATAPTSVALYILRADALLGTLSIDNMMIEEGTAVSPYFDGGTAAAGDFTYLWSGVANASTSIQRAPAVENFVGGSAMAVIQSKDWKLSGANSARVVPRTATQDTYGVVAGVTLETGKTYTISATCRLTGAQTTTETRARKIVVYHSATSHASSQAANAAGSTRLSVTFTVTDGSVYQSIRLYNGASQGNGDIWWDDLLVEETPSLQPYFDGTNTFGNLAINNPNLEVNLDGWATNDATKYPIARSTVSPIRGTASAVVTRSATSPDTIVASIWVNGKSPTNLTAFKVSPGQSLSFSMDVRSSAANRKAVAYVAFRDAAGTSIGSYGTTETTLTSGIAARAGASNITVPANADSALFVMSVQSTNASIIPANETATFDGLLIENSASITPYYYEGTGDYTYAWSGAANASVSYQQAPGASGVGYVSSLGYAYQSKSVGNTSGTKSIRITPTNASNGDSFAELNGMLGGYVFKPNTVYTISGNRTILAPQTNLAGTTHFRMNVGTELTPTLVASVANVAGTQRVVARFTTGSGTGLGFIRIYNGSYFGGGDVWWDDIVLEEGITNGTYFDGANPIQNLVTNPSFEVNTTGWTQYLSTISRDTTESHLGSASLKVVTTGQGGPSLSPQIAVTANTTYTQSAWVKAPNGQAMTMQMLQYSPSAVNLKTTSVAFTGTGAWQRVSLTDTIALGVTLMTPYIFAGVSGVTFWVDAVLVERSAVLNPYYEGLGDFSYAWTGTANASSSEQRGFSVSGRQAVAANSVVYHSGVRTVTGTKSGAIRTRADILVEGTLMYPVSEYMVESGTVRLTPNASHTWSMSVWVPSGSGTIRLQDIASGAIGAPNTLFDQWDRISVTFTAPATGGSTLRMRANTTVPAGTVIWWDNELLETTNVVQEYFDGSTTTSVDYTYSWAGTANNSASRKQAPSVSNVSGGNTVPHQSSEWSASAKSLRMFPLNVSGSNATSVMVTADLVPGRTYTALATRRLAAPLTGTLNSAYGGRMALVQPGLATLSSDALPNVAGVGTLRWTFTVDPAATGHTFRLGHGGVAGSGDVWWDNVMIVEGTYTGDYVDGSKPFSKWNGTASASTSVGYPPQLLDIAGKPFTDVSGIGDTGTVNVDPFSARTIYFVYESTDINASWQAPLYYGVGGSNGITFQTNAAGVDGVAPRVDFSGGDSNRTFVSSSRGVGRRHVLAITFPQGIASAVANFNGGSDIAQTYTSVGTGWANGRVYTIARTGIAAVRTIVYYAEHNATTRLAISRYLGNKYGATVA